MDAEIISTLVNAGGQAVLLFILSAVWAELKAANQYTRDLLTKQQRADDDRAELKLKVQALEDRKPPTASSKPGSRYLDQ